MLNVHFPANYWSEYFAMFTALFITPTQAFQYSLLSIAHLLFPSFKNHSNTQIWSSNLHAIYVNQDCCPVRLLLQQVILP